MRGSSSASSTGLPRGPVAALVLILAASLQLQRAPAAAQTASQAQQGSAHPFRLWLDQRYFAPNELFYVRAEVAKASPALQIAGEALQANDTHGIELASQWDAYHTIRNLCYLVPEDIQRPKLVNCVPGSEAFTLKKTLVHVLQAAYGEHAFQFLPRSYTLPEQEHTWHAYTHMARVGQDTTWALKTNIHRGKGVHLQGLAKAQQLVQDSVKQFAKIFGPRTNTAQSSTSRPLLANKLTAEALRVLDQPAYVVAQEAVTPQWTWQGRNSYVRVWAVITSVDPLRVYVFKGGLVIFGAAKHPPTDSNNGQTQAHTANHREEVVNLWQQNRTESVVWTLQQLRQYVTRHPPQQDGKPGRRLLAQGQSLAEPRLTHIPEAQATLRPAYTASMQQSHHSQRRTHDTPRHAAQPQDSPSTRATVDSDHTPSRPADTVQQQRRRLQKTKADSDKDIGIATNREGKHGRQRRQPRRRQPARRRRAVDAGPLSAAGAAAFDAMWARMREAIGLAATAAVPHLRHAGSVNRSILRQEAALWSSQVDGMGGLGPTLRDDNTTQSRDAGQASQSHRYLFRPAGYELLGADFLLDSSLRPYLVEINSLPSMAPRDECGDRDQCAAIAAMFAAQELEEHTGGASSSIHDQAGAVGARSSRRQHRRGRRRGAQTAEPGSDSASGSLEPRRRRRSQARARKHRQHAGTDSDYGTYNSDPAAQTGEPRRRRRRPRRRDAVAAAADTGGRGGARSLLGTTPTTAAGTVNASTAAAHMSVQPQPESVQRIIDSYRDSFGREKHRATRDLMTLLGMPVHPCGLDSEGPQLAERTVDTWPDQEPEGVRSLVSQILGKSHKAGTARAEAKQEGGGTHKDAGIDGGDMGVHTVSGFGPASNRGGAGATITLAAALLAQAMPASAAGGDGAPTAGDARAMVARVGGAYPRALSAAMRALQHIRPLMCPGLFGSSTQNKQSATGSQGTQTKGRAGSDGVSVCAEGCLWLHEVQLVGELEMELSARGQYQQLYPLQDAVALNQYALSETQSPDNRKGAGGSQGSKGGWWSLHGLGSLFGGHPFLRLRESPYVHASVRLHESAADWLTRLAAAVRANLKAAGRLQNCTRDENAAAECAVLILRSVVAARCKH